MRAKFVEICPLFPKIFKEISNDISQSFFENSKNFRRKYCVEIENSEKLMKLRWNEVSNERNSEEFSHKWEETSRHFQRNESNMEISWRTDSKINITLYHLKPTLWHQLYLFSFYHAYFFCSTVGKFFASSWSERSTVRCQFCHLQRQIFPVDFLFLFWVNVFSH